MMRRFISIIELGCHSVDVVEQYLEYFKTLPLYLVKLWAVYFLVLEKDGEVLGST